MTRFIRFAAAVLIASLVAPGLFAQRGSADFTRFVALGDSYGAGIESGSLNMNHQPYSWPAVIARQVGLTLCPPTAAAADNCFAQPLVTFPGIGNELILSDIVRFPPVIAPAPGSGQPVLLTFGRPFNNLSIPGANVTDLTTLTGRENPPRRTSEQFAQFILRGLGTPVDQALAQRPTFVAIWIGGNDALGAVLSGTPNALTSVDTFRTSYNAMLDRLIAGAPNAGMVVGNIPNTPASLPYLTTVPPVIINPSTRQPILGPDGNPIFLFADLGGGTLGQLGPGSFVSLAAAARLSTGFGIPPTLRNVPPFNLLPNAGQPLSDAEVLTASEVSAIVNRVNEFNDVIRTAAAARNIPVADIKGLFDRVASNRFAVGPFPITGAFITGGFFSLDGFHLTDIGYTLFANEYIKTINAAYDTHIPVASLAQFLTNRGAIFPTTTSGLMFIPGMEWELSEEAREAILKFAPPPPQRRLRATGH